MIVTAWIALALGIVLLLVSAFMSMSETAFFSLSPSHLEELKRGETKRDKIVLELLENPHKLLATILIGNNFVNIVITLLLAFFTYEVLPDDMSEIVKFLIETVLITFVLLMFGEITPKVYATVQPLKMSRFAAGGLRILTKILTPFSILLVKSTSIVEHRMEKHSHANLSMDELSQAVELTDIATEEEKDILEGITKFGNRQVSDVMRSRLDIVDIDIKANYKELLNVIIS